MGQSQAGPGAHTCPWQAGLRAAGLGVGRPGFASQIVHLAARGPGACGFPLSLSDLVRLEGSRPASPGASAPGPSHSRKSRHPLAPPGSPAHTKGSLCPCCTHAGCGHVSLPTGLLREQQGGWQAGCSSPLPTTALCPPSSGRSWDGAAALHRLPFFTAVQTL